MPKLSTNPFTNRSLLLLLAVCIAIPATAQQTPAGSFPHFATGGGWKTTFRLHNTSASPTHVTLDFFGDNGAAQKVPLAFVQSSTAGFTSSSVSATLSPGQEWIVTTNTGTDQPETSGWALLSTDGAVTGFAVFTLHAGNALNEAVVPIETRNPARFTLAFDNKDRYASGIAIANTAGVAAAIPVTIRDDQGKTLGTNTFYLPSFGHKAMLMPNEWPVSGDQRGTIEFNTPANGQIAVLGLSFNPTINFSTIPPESFGSAAGISSPEPAISGITPVAAQQNQTITITGSGFGTHAAYTGNSSFIEIVNSGLSGWGAGFLNSDFNSAVTLNVASWTDTKIVLNGFAGSFGQTGKTIKSGDPLQVRVWNAQSMKGPAFYRLTAVDGVTSAAPLVIFTSTLQNATVGYSYYLSLLATGGTGPQTWSLTPGSSLPLGLTLKNDVISGTTSSAGTFLFGVQVVDMAGKSASRTLSLTVTAATSGTGGSGGSGGSGGTGSVYTGTGTVITPALNNCVSNFYDANYYHWWTSTNNCGVAIHVQSLWKLARSGSYTVGSADITAGKTQNWGYSTSEVADRSGYVQLICPGGYISVDSTGLQSTIPTATYWCRKQ